MAKKRRLQFLSSSSSEEEKEEKDVDRMWAGRIEEATTSQDADARRHPKKQKVWILPGYDDFDLSDPKEQQKLDPFFG